MPSVAVNDKVGNCDLECEPWKVNKAGAISVVAHGMSRFCARQALASFASGTRQGACGRRVFGGFQRDSARTSKLAAVLSARPHI